jgi:hypothetical protein
VRSAAARRAAEQGRRLSDGEARCRRSPTFFARECTAPACRQTDGDETVDDTALRDRERVE